MRIALTVNGRPADADVTPRTNLADFLREKLLLTGTHVGCEHGICGACTVEIDGEIARSCITYAVTCDGADVRTIEGFDDDPLMARLRKAFTEEHALQCGYCTPGMLVAARDLVRRKTELSRGQIRTEMSGNLCRCTGYMGIVNAIERVMTNGTADAQRDASQARAWLGPAPGPQAGTTSSPSTAGVHTVPRRVAVAPPAQHPHRSQAGRRRISVTAGPVKEKDGIVRLTQSFVLGHARDAVWQLLSDPQAAAHCMPGASLDGPPQDGNISGRIEIKLGPIAATFVGEGTVAQFPAEYRQVIEGRGGDRKSGSRVTGTVDYRLSAVTAEVGSDGTRVDIVIGYGLMGLLAQLGRSELARDLARHMGETFAQNVDALLRDPAAESMQDSQINGLALVYRAIAARVRSFFARIFGP
jgi:aerobic carbon-monoxide dehydrogenase small subunit